MKVRIPLLVTKTGAVMSGLYWCDAGGKNGKSDWDVAVDSLAEDDYQSGYQVVTVEADIDVEALFKANTVDGVVAEVQKGGE